MTLKPQSVVINTAAASPQELVQDAVDTIRRRLDNHFLGMATSPEMVAGMTATLQSVLKEMGQTGVIRHPPLTEQDVQGITEVLMLEWSAQNYEGDSYYDPGLGARVTPVAAPDVRAICGSLSDQAIQAMTAPYEYFGDCENVARFFFLEKMRREGKIIDWTFTWTDLRARTGELTITPKEAIKYISVGMDVEL